MKDKIATDYWGHEWGYTPPDEDGGTFKLWSLGKDGEEDTEDDIRSWDTDEEDEFGDFDNFGDTRGGGR